MKISSAFSGVPLWQFSSHKTVFFSKSLRQLGACEFHTEMGKLILEHGGTLERFTGDGMMPRSVRSVLKNGSVTYLPSAVSRAGFAMRFGSIPDTRA